MSSALRSLPLFLALSLAASQPGLAAGQTILTVGEHDSFGWAVAIDASSADHPVLIGAPDTAARYGAAYFYEAGQLTRLDTSAAGLAAHGWFGAMVAIDAGTAVISSYFPAALHFFRRDTTGWSFAQKIDLAPLGIGSDFSLALLGDQLVVGDPYIDTGKGEVFLFKLQAGVWQPNGVLLGPGFEAGNIGYSVALDGDRLAVSGSRAVFLFERNGMAGWSLARRIAFPEPISSVIFPTSVALRGDILAVGVPIVPPNHGRVFLYQRNAGGPDAWGLEQTLAPTAPRPEAGDPRGDLFGKVVALDLAAGPAGRLVVGAPGDDNSCFDGLDPSCNAGSVYLYERRPAGNSWEKKLELAAENADYDRNLGWSVAIAGDDLIAGEPNFAISGGSGSAALFDLGSSIADLSVTKTDGVDRTIPLGSLTYTIVVSNLGPDRAMGAVLEDPLHAFASSDWSCQGTGGARCTQAGHLSIRDVLDLPAGSTATYTVHASLGPGPAGAIVNTASVRAPADTIDPVPANNTTTDRDIVDPDCNGNGIGDPVDLARGTSADINGNGQPDECEILRGTWTVGGTAAGGQVSIMLRGYSGTCAITIATSSGQSAATVATSLAAAINASSCALAQGLMASAAGPQLTVRGFVFDVSASSLTTTDPGLSFALPTTVIPTLSPVGLLAAMAALLWFGLRQLARRRRLEAPAKTPADP